MAATIKEIAQRANVSIATVSRSLNNGPRVKKETRRLVMKIAKEMNYNPNLLARNFVKKRTSTIGLVMPDLVDEFFTEIIRGVDEVAFSQGYHMMVANTHSSRSMIESIMGFMGNGLVDGVILMAPTLDDSAKEVLKNSRTPLVLIGDKSGLEHLDAIEIDNYQGAYDMTRYLAVKKGYRKIAHITGPPQNTDALSRLNGYKCALEDNCIDVDSKLIIGGDFTIRGGEMACRKLLSGKNRPEVIFAANDMMAIGCYNVITRRKMRIPEDIAVTGFDNIFVSGFLSPRLTTVDVPISELGRSAASILLSKVSSPGKSGTKKISLPVKLVTGESC